MGCHCLRYTVNPNIDPWHNDSPTVRPCHPSAACDSTYDRAPKSHFSIRQCSATHSKDVTKLPPLHYHLFPGFLDLQICHQLSISGII
ncbi:hypothetical protein TNCV_1982941 [Trichonephila clavipes]|nr:hypothetical protein TNCV_1982941 [Trichonephila clavipes]